MSDYLQMHRAEVGTRNVFHPGREERGREKEDKNNKTAISGELGRHGEI